MYIFMCCNFEEDDVSNSLEFAIEKGKSIKMFLKGLPHYASGKVVKGFGRGSKQLGIPTANFPVEVVEALPPNLSTGVYYGWANVDGGPVYKMVMSIGWNPFYNNVKKSMETHILHAFQNDFYGSLLRVCILGYIRPEQDFNSVGDLISAIKSDIEAANKALDDMSLVPYKNDPFFESKSPHEH